MPVSRWWLIFPLALAAGCDVFQRVPPGVTVTCLNGGACPNGLVCQPVTGVCVDQLDEEGPNITPTEPQYRGLDGVPSGLTVTALGPHSQLQFTFSVGEPLFPGSTPVLSPTHEAVRCQLGLIGPLNFAVTCLTDAVGRYGEDTFVVAITAVDVNGVQRTKETASCRFDDTAPPQPDTADGGVWLHVAPWGDDESQYRESTRLLALPERAPGAQALLVEQPDAGAFTPTLVFLGGDGGWDGPISNIDLEGTLPTVRAFDGAGNGSSPAEVHRVHWLATFSTETNGTNPHHYFVSRASSDGVIGEASTDLTAVVPNRLWGTANALDLAGGGVWERVESSKSPGRRGGVLGAYDLERSRVVRFGGGNGTAPGDLDPDVWEWMGLDWQPRTPDAPLGGRPSARFLAAMAWAPGSRSMMLVGGSTGTGGSLDALRDAWLWNGRTWTRLPDFAGGSTQGRKRAMLVWERSSRRMAILGGLNGNEVPADNWLRYNPLNGSWTGNVASTPEFARGLVDGTATNDPRDGRPFIYGGWRLLNDAGVLDHDAGVATFDDALWSDALDGGFVRLDAGPGPGPRGGVALVVDVHRDRLLLHGGVDSTGVMLDDTWELSLGDGGVWTSLDAGVGPGRRASHALVAALESREVLLFGEAINGQRDTWALVDEQWQPRALPSPQPDRLVGDVLLPAGDGGARAFGFADLDGGGALDPVEVTILPSWASSPLAPPQVLGWPMWQPVGSTALALSAYEPTVYRRSGLGWSPVLHLDAGVGNTGRQMDLSTVLAVAPRASDAGTEVEVFVSNAAGNAVVRRVWTGSSFANESPSMPFATAARAVAFGDTRAAVLGFDPTFTQSAQPRLWLPLEDGGLFSRTLPVIGTPSSFSWHPSRGSFIVAGFVQPTSGLDPSVWEYNLAADAGWAQVPLSDVDGLGGPTYRQAPIAGYVGGVMTLVERKVATPSANAGELRGDLTPVAAWRLRIGVERPQVVLRFVTPLPSSARVLALGLSGRAGGRGGTPTDPLGVRAQLRRHGYWSPNSTVNGATINNERAFELWFDPTEVVEDLTLDHLVSLRLQTRANNGDDFAVLNVSGPQLEVRYER